jgi:hypothetical protein
MWRSEQSLEVPSKYSKNQAQTLKYFFSFTRQPKNFKTESTDLIYLPFKKKYFFLVIPTL